MGFPRKFKKLLEIELDDVIAPDEAWLTYAVCAVEQDSCGWGGWMLEAAIAKPEKDDHFMVLPAVDEQLCPKCGRATFRTGASLRFVPSADQTPTCVPGIDYEVLPIDYDEE
jgi:hypothetical protein